MKLNINSKEEIVKVKLNVKGAERLKDRYNSGFLKYHTDKDGYTHLRFREFMSIFGEMCNAQWTLPFDEEIIIGE